MMWEFDTFAESTKQKNKPIKTVCIFLRVSVPPSPVVCVRGFKQITMEISFYILAQLISEFEFYILEKKKRF